MLKSREKKQSVVRLDAEELDRMTAIQSQLGLSKTGVIRRLIRDFNLESENVKPASKFIVDGQISKDVFLQLPVRNVGLAIFSESYLGMYSEVYFAKKLRAEVAVIGYVNYIGLPSDAAKYSIIYSLRGAICRHDNIKFTGLQSSIEIPDHGLMQIDECLQQIFVV